MGLKETLNCVDSWSWVLKLVAWLSFVWYIFHHGYVHYATIYMTILKMVERKDMLAFICEAWGTFALT